MLNSALTLLIFLILLRLTGLLIETLDMLTCCTLDTVQSQRRKHKICLNLSEAMH